jgi:outer membrane protein OmpA-like peptidoglycan-associated protein
VPTDKNYMLNVSKPGYLFYSENIALEGVFEIENPFIQDVPLEPIQVGKTIVLENVFFDTDSYELKKESIAELQKIVGFLKENPHVRIEIGGHTDTVGTKSYNDELSKNRAKSVVEYLTAQGVAAEKISFKGYGFDKPIATNQTEAGRAKNRRTELKIMGQ